MSDAVTPTPLILQAAADCLPAGAAVLDVGGGGTALEPLLPPGCRYVPCDRVARDQRTLVCDWASGEIPAAPEVTHVTLLGVLEHVQDVPRLLARLRAGKRPVIVSYHPAGQPVPVDRRARGWVNDLDEQALEELLRQAGFAVQVRMPVPPDQVLWRLVPATEPTRKPLRVLVLSSYKVGNFGDRLGYHLINSLLPPDAVVQHAWFNFQQAALPAGVPQEAFDLLILGLGHSLSGSMLSERLLQVLQLAPARIGVFGTQYRHNPNADVLARVLDSLDHWYARSGEDVLLYGKGRSNVTHMGDWLISAFPMAVSRDPRTLVIGKEIWNNLPLDRIIQEIQTYQSVVSPRLHPLLCALTSARQVAYREQRDPQGRPSGKFRALLLDVFGRTFPEDEPFAVDRAAVVAYKRKVHEQVADLQTRLSRLAGGTPPAVGLATCLP